MPDRLSDESDDIRQRIIDAATAEFAEEGYQAAKMADMARHAGVSLRTLYNYFRRKEILYLHTVGMSFFEGILKAAAAAPTNISVIRAVVAHLMRTEDRRLFEPIELKAYDGLLYDRLEVEIAEIVQRRTGPMSNKLVARTEAALVVLAVKSLQWPEYAEAASEEPAVREQWLDVLANLSDDAINSLRPRRA
jgi:AcrR family transcriptional regulator